MYSIQEGAGNCWQCQLGPPQLTMILVALREVVKRGPSAGRWRPALRKSDVMVRPRPLWSRCRDTLKRARKEK